MIYTVTLNPAVDRTLWVESLSFGESIRIKREEHYAGGKGIDVSRVIKLLGGESVALGFIGGYTGLEIEGILMNEGISISFTKIAEETRTNIIAHCLHDGTELKLNARGPEISPIELAHLKRTIESLKPPPTIAVLSGSLPPGLDAGIYSQLVLSFEALGAKAFVDSDGEALRRALASTPFLIKPNRLELEHLVEQELTSFKEIAQAAHEIASKWVEVCLVSLGEEGVIMATKSETLHFIPPPVEAKNTVGAGDSVVAGVALSLHHGKSLRDAVRDGVAAGTASTLTEGTATIEPNDVAKIASEITIETID